MIHRRYFIKRHSETVTVRNYRIAHCSLKDKFVVLFIIIFGSLPFPIRAEYCDERVCLSVCLSVCPQACLRDYNFCVCVSFVWTAARSSSVGVAIRYVLPVLWMTSYSHTLCSGCTLIQLQRVTSLRRRMQANAPATSCRRRQRAPRLDESIVQGVSGSEPAIHHRCMIISTRCPNKNVHLSFYE